METIASRYERDGYVSPVQAFSIEQAATYRAALEAVEQSEAGRALKNVLFYHSNYVLPFADEIARLPSIVKPVQEILGPDLLLWGASIFSKDAKSPDFISWHQDLTYWGLDHAAEVTAWVALSPSTAESGCMRFIPGSHKKTIVPHKDTFQDENMLSRGQVIAEDIDESAAVNVELQPGQVSLHHGNLFHASHPNRSDDRRIGLALRYITPEMRNVSGEKTCAHLISGEDRFGHFHLQNPPSGVLNPVDLRAAQQAIELENKALYDGAAQEGKRVQQRIS